VVQLIVFCALIGMLLAEPGVAPLPMRLALGHCRASGCVAGAAVAVQLPHRSSSIDAPHGAHRLAAHWPAGELTPRQALVFSPCSCGGLGVRCCCTSGSTRSTMWLTLATFVGYAVDLHRASSSPLTPQNIVIGGASGAMPPVLGWAASRPAMCGPRR
jgi:protoheme IX farnesyltransferase